MEWRGERERMTSAREWKESEESEEESNEDKNLREKRNEKRKKEVRHSLQPLGCKKWPILNIDCKPERGVSSYANVVVFCLLLSAFFFFVFMPSQTIIKMH